MAAQPGVTVVTVVHCASAVAVAIAEAEQDGTPTVELISRHRAHAGAGATLDVRHCVLVAAKRGVGVVAMASSVPHRSKLLRVRTRICARLHAQPLVPRRQGARAAARGRVGRSGAKLVRRVLCARAARLAPAAERATLVAAIVRHLVSAVRAMMAAGDVRAHADSVDKGRLALLVGPSLVEREAQRGGLRDHREAFR